MRKQSNTKSIATEIDEYHQYKSVFTFATSYTGQHITIYSTIPESPMSAILLQYIVSSPGRSRLGGKHIIWALGHDIYWESDPPGADDLKIWTATQIIFPF